MSQKSWPYPMEHCQVRNVYASAGVILYSGFSNDPTAVVGDAKWAIQKFLYTGDGDVSAIVWADDSDDMNKIWTARAGYTYQE